MPENGNVHEAFREDAASRAQPGCNRITISVFCRITALTLVRSRGCDLFGFVSVFCEAAVKASYARAPSALSPAGSENKLILFG